MNEFRDHFGSHLRELRQRVLISFVAVALLSSVAYLYIKPISRLFLAPLRRASPELVSLVYTNLTEAFFSYLKLSILVGIIASFPLLIYQAWMYVAPGLHQREKKLALIIVFFATALFAGGVLFAYLVVLPEVLSFFMGFARDNLTALPKFGAYLTFVARTGLAFGLAFQIPFLMVAAAKASLVSRGYFADKRLYYYAVLLLLSFLLTAGDPFSAVLLGLPLAGLYELGVIIIRIW